LRSCLVELIIRTPAERGAGRRLLVISVAWATRNHRQWFARRTKLCNMRVDPFDAMREPFGKEFWFISGENVTVPPSRNLDLLFKPTEKVVHLGWFELRGGYQDLLGDLFDFRERCIPT